MTTYESVDDQHIPQGPRYTFLRPPRGCHHGQLAQDNQAPAPLGAKSVMAGRTLLYASAVFGRCVRETLLIHHGILEELRYGLLVYAEKYTYI